jgi:hypothetical protein
MKQIIKFGEYVLQPADVIVARRIEGAVFDHYLVYEGDGMFVAKMQQGVVRMTIEQLQQFTGIYVPVRMRQFHGSEFDRRLALLRADECLYKPYSLLFSNCEHFADYVQYGTHTSLQSAKAGIGLIGVGAVMASESKDETVQFLGGLSIAAGILALINEATGANNKQLSPPSYKKF